MKRLDVKEEIRQHELEKKQAIEDNLELHYEELSEVGENMLDELGFPTEREVNLVFSIICFAIAAVLVLSYFLFCNN